LFRSGRDGTISAITSTDRITSALSDAGGSGPTAPSVAEHDQQPTEREVRKQMSSMAANELGPMLTASEVAELLHLHVNTVKRLGDRGELPFYRVCKRGDRRFRLEDVMAFLARNR
jgi:excisionase family DNA binding protein